MRLLSREMRSSRAGHVVRNPATIDQSNQILRKAGNLEAGNLGLVGAVGLEPTTR